MPRTLVKKLSVIHVDPVPRDLAKSSGFVDYAEHITTDRISSVDEKSSCNNITQPQLDLTSSAFADVEADGQSEERDTALDSPVIRSPTAKAVKCKFQNESFCEIASTLEEDAGPEVSADVTVATSSDKIEVAVECISGELVHEAEQTCYQVIKDKHSKEAQLLTSSQRGQGDCVNGTPSQVQRRNHLKPIMTSVTSSHGIFASRKRGQHSAASAAKSRGKLETVGSNGIHSPNNVVSHADERSALAQAAPWD